jgi:hypothetical protein
MGRHLQMIMNKIFTGADLYSSPRNIRLYSFFFRATNPQATANEDLSGGVYHPEHSGALWSGGVVNLVSEWSELFRFIFLRNNSSR